MWINYGMGLFNSIYIIIQKHTRPEGRSYLHVEEIVCAKMQVHSQYKCILNYYELLYVCLDG